MLTIVTFIGFTAFVAIYAWWKLRKHKMDSSDGFFLGGRSLTGVVIAGSMLLTNISTEHLIGMNGSSYKNGFIIIGWEVTSAIALVVAAVYFVPKYLRMGLTTIPEYLENRFDVDARRIYVSGFSNGASMTFRVGAALSHRRSTWACRFRRSLRHCLSSTAIAASDCRPTCCRRSAIISEPISTNASTLPAGGSFIRTGPVMEETQLHPPTQSDK